MKPSKQIYNFLNDLFNLNGSFIVNYNFDMNCVDNNLYIKINHDNDSLRIEEYTKFLKKYFGKESIIEIGNNFIEIIILNYFIEEKKQNDRT